MSRLGRFVCLLLATVTVAGAAPAAEAHRPWATPLKQPGVPNLHRVTTNLFRSAQPTAAGMKSIEALGIKTVISLRAFHDDQDEVESTQLKTERIRFNTWHAEDEDVVRFLKLVTATNNGPILVHCLHGSDRTGTMIAIYRMAVQGWPKDEAIKEMTGGDFGYHTMWKNLIEYLEKLDVEALRKKAGISFPPAK